MARYIDADKLIAEYDRVHIGHPGGARKLMVEAPTADVVEVVRCKNCKYWQDKNSKGTQGICLCGEKDMNYKDMNYGGEFYPFANDFCSYGERTPQKEG